MAINDYFRDNEERATCVLEYDRLMEIPVTGAAAEPRDAALLGWAAKWGEKIRGYVSPFAARAPR